MTDVERFWEGSLFGQRSRARASAPAINGSKRAKILDKCIAAGSFPSGWNSCERFSTTSSSQQVTRIEAVMHFSGQEMALLDGIPESERMLYFEHTPDEFD